MKTTKLLTVVMVLQGLILAGQWTGPHGGPHGVGGYGTPAMAQIPDAGSQRLVMIEELRSINAKLDRLTTKLERGEVQVRVAMPDEQ